MGTHTLAWPLSYREQIDWELKREGGKFDVDGKLYDTLQLTTIVDGYTAPITSGNFVDLVQKGFYNGYKVQVRAAARAREPAAHQL